MPSIATIRLLLATALLAAAAGCGGDDGLSADEYRSEANEICRTGNERIEQILEDATGELESDSPSPERLGDVLGRSLDEIRRQMSEVRALDGPNELEADVNDVIGDAEEAADALDQQLDEDPVAALEQEEDPFEDVNRRLTDLGLTECGAS